MGPIDRPELPFTPGFEGAKDRVKQAVRHLSGCSAAPVVVTCVRSLQHTSRWLIPRAAAYACPDRGSLSLAVSRASGYGQTEDGACDSPTQAERWPPQRSIRRTSCPRHAPAHKSFLKAGSATTTITAGIRSIPSTRGTNCGANNAPRLEISVSGLLAAGPRRRHLALASAAT